MEEGNIPQKSGTDTNISKEHKPLEQWTNEDVKAWFGEDLDYKNYAHLFSLNGKNLARFTEEQLQSICENKAIGSALFNSLRELKGSSSSAATTGSTSQPPSPRRVYVKMSEDGSHWTKQPVKQFLGNLPERSKIWTYSDDIRDVVELVNPTDEVLVENSKVIVTKEGEDKPAPSEFGGSDSSAASTGSTSQPPSPRGVYVKFMNKGQQYWENLSMESFTKELQKLEAFSIWSFHDILGVLKSEESQILAGQSVIVTEDETPPDVKDFITAEPHDFSASPDPESLILVNEHGMEETLLIDELIAVTPDYDVYSAKQADSILAIKLPRNSKAEELARKEAKILQHLNGIQGVAQLKGFGFVKNLIGQLELFKMARWGLCLAFEGQSLQSLRFRLDIAHLQKLFASVIQTLKRIHSQGVIHWDISPGNIVVNQRQGDFTAHLIDFDCAKMMDDNQLSFQAIHGNFSSRNQHIGGVPCPGDDVESAAYVYLWMQEELPWEGFNPSAMYKAKQNCSNVFVKTIQNDLFSPKYNSLCQLLLI